MRDQLEARWARSWLPITSGFVTLLFAHPLYRLWTTLPPTRFPPHSHTIIFEYIGWFLSAGGRLYVDIWAIKPPLAHLFPMTVAVLSGGNVHVYHFALVVLTALAAAGSVVAVALVGYRLTGSRAAGLAGATIPLTAPNFLWRPTLGFEPKYFILLLGLLSLYLVLEGRPFGAGIAAASAAGMWQLAVAFPTVVLVELVRRDRRLPRRALAGMGLVALVGLLPVLYWRAVPEMLSEVLLTTLVVSTEGGDLLTGFRLLEPLTLVLVAAGLLGHLLLLRDWRTYWWVVAVAAWFVVQLTFIDADGFPDTFVLLGLAGVGLAVLVAELPRRVSVPGPSTWGGFPVRGVVAVLLLFGVLWTVSRGWGFVPHYFTGDLARPQPLRPPINPGELEYAFWLTQQTPTCRFFDGATQEAVVRRFGGSMTAEHCGRYFWPMLRALLP